MFVICHYSEIGLKGKNRKFFEEKLVENIKKALPKGSFRNVRRISGRLLVEGAKLLPGGLSSFRDCLKNVFGIANFAFAQSCQQDIESIETKAAEILKKKEFHTFRVVAQRSEKTFPLTSQQLNERVGAYILGRSFAPSKEGASLPVKPKVDLENPDITLFIEIVDPIRNLAGFNGAGKYAFLYTKKIMGLGGLPVGVSGKAVSLISGGIDSPVASFYAMKRGIEVIFLHLHGASCVDESSIEKVKRNVKVLSRFQGKAKLYLAPFCDIQKAIFEKLSNKELCCVLCKRFMMRMAEAMAKKEKAKAIITGENIGQVASQTLPNIAVIEQAADLPILKPLAFFDKQETIDKAKQIGTYDISILPEKTFCQNLLPPHPTTNANLSEVKKEEAKLNVDKLIKEAIQRSQLLEV